MKRMENRSIEGDRPVIENPSTPRDFLSNTMHVKLRMNLRRPRRKPKYSLATDSEQVPRGKGEKRSEEHTSELQSQSNLVCRLLLEKKKRTHLPHAAESYT